MAAHATQTSPSGEYHLLGPPGTGKTTALTRTWIPKAINEYGPKCVAVVSLTRAAAREIASRQVVALPPERVGTLHSFARRALTDAFGKPELAQVDLALDRWNDEIARGDPKLLLSGASKRLSQDASAGEGFESSRGRAQRTGSLGLPQTGDEKLAAIEILRHQGVPVDDWPSWLRDFWAKWRDWKVAEQLFDFTDLIERAIDQKAPPPALDGSPVRALFVDEAQDCSHLEMELVRQWQTQVTITVLSGDPNQSIYGFRGAEAGAFHDPETFPEDRTYVLGQSYRVPPAIQTFAERFLRRSRKCVKLDYDPKKDAGNGLVTHTTHTFAKRHVPELVSNIQATLLQLRESAKSDSTMQPDDSRVMVLASAAYMLKPVIAELRARGVLFYNPFQLERGEWNPLRSAHRHIASLFLGPRPDLTGDDGPGGRPPRFWTWGELKDWTDVLQAKGVLRHGAKANLIADQAKKRPRAIMDASDVDRVFTDPKFIRGDLFEMLADPEREAEAVKWLGDAMTAANRRRLAYALSVAKRNLRSLIEEPRVIVGTIHSVKGGTAGAVFLSPELSRRHEAERTSSAQGFDGMIRLFYVGMTRASRRLVLLSPSRRGRRTTPHIEW